MNIDRGLYRFNIKFMLLPDRILDLIKMYVETGS